MKKLLILITIGFYILWRTNSPYPYPLNWDIWEHQTVINAIRHGSFAVLPSQLSDTFRFDGYTTAFHTLIAGIQNVFQVTNILGFWWIAEGIFFVLTSLATYELVYALTKNKLTALTGGILSAGFFESAMAFTTLFLIPQTFTALLWVVGMTVLLRQTTQQKRVLIAVITTCVILPFHAIIGSLGVLFLFTLALDLNIHWIFVLAVSYVVPTFIANHFGLNSLNNGEAQHFNQTIIQKLALSQQWYGFLPIPFLLLGIKKANRNLRMLIAASVGLVASPFPYVLKFMVIIHYLMIAIMALGIGEFFDLLKSHVARYVVLTTLTVTVGIIFFTNTTHWKELVTFRGIASQISEDEIDAARFLNIRYKNNPEMFIISDPATQYILEPLTDIDTQGGAYMNAGSRKTLITAIQKNDLAMLQSIHKGNMLLVISARTIQWLAAKTKDQMSIAFNIWRPDALSLNDELTIQNWEDKLAGRKVYQNPGMVIFEVPYDTK